MCCNRISLKVSVAGMLFLFSHASTLLYAFLRNAVIHRIFPIARGIFEDKVASIWCGLDPVLKLRRRLESGELRVGTLLVVW